MLTFSLILNIILFLTCIYTIHCLKQKKIQENFIEQELKFLKKRVEQLKTELFIERTKVDEE